MATVTVPAERVRPYKRETNGNPAQLRPYPQVANPQEDALDVRGVFFQEPGTDDLKACIFRKDGILYFRDNAVGAGQAFALGDLAGPAALTDDTQHGNRGGGSLHALAVAGGNAGFLSGTDKSNLDALQSAHGGKTYLPLSGGKVTGDLSVESTRGAGSTGLSVRELGDTTVSALAELFQAEGTGIHPISLRFHQGNRWYHRIRASGDGFTFVDGATDTQVPVRAGSFYENGTQLSSKYLQLNGVFPITQIYEPTYITGSVSKTARPLFDVLRPDRTAFLPPDQIIIEKSTDAGATWQDAGYSDSDKRRLFTGARPTIVIPLKNGKRDTDCMLRVTITGMKYNVPQGTAETARYNYWNSTYVTGTERYCTFSEGWAWVSSLNDHIHCKVEYATGRNSAIWYPVRDAYMAGWSGGNYFSLNGAVFGGGTNQVDNTWNWRFTFRTCSQQNDFDNAKLVVNEYSQYAQAIYHLKLEGENVWNTANNLMYNDHLYQWDEYQNGYFPANLFTATSLGVGGGTFENSEGWNRVIDLVGTDHSKLSVRASNTGIDVRMHAHGSGIYNAPAGGIIGTKSNHPLSLMSSGLSRMTILADGKIGIGKTNPGVLLDVAGDIRSNGLINSPKFSIQRKDNITSGIIWYDATYPWYTYMGPAGGGGQGPRGDLTAPIGTYVGGWALRNVVENNAGYGWTWESVLLGQTAPALIAELRSDNGTFRTIGEFYSGANKVWHAGNFDPSTKLGTAHAADAVAHVTAAERTSWNGKLGATRAAIEGTLAGSLVGSLDIGGTLSKNGSPYRPVYQSGIDPTPFAHDIDNGFEVGDRWLNTSTNDEFVCLKNTRDAAVWKNTTSGGDLDFSRVRTIATLNPPPGQPFSWALGNGIEEFIDNLPYHRVMFDGDLRGSTYLYLRWGFQLFDAADDSRTFWLETSNDYGTSWNPLAGSTIAPRFGSANDLDIANQSGVMSSGWVDSNGNFGLNCLLRIMSSDGNIEPTVFGTVTIEVSHVQP